MAPHHFVVGRSAVSLQSDDGFLAENHRGIRLFMAHLPLRSDLAIRASSEEFEDGIREIVNWAKDQQAYMNGEKIRCPCRKCKNCVFKTTDEVMFDICMKGFIEGYYNWTAHGEAQVIEYYDDPPAQISVETPVAPNVATHWGDVEQMNWDQRMVYDAAGPHFFSAHPNPEPVGASSSFPIDGTEAGPSSYGYDVSRLSD
ncbi:UNVERIFIED_CONTAM: hypothetical protein Slati_0925600 [Sesamum latifolium]|uniref:Transposase-associated domain-containing protein n=1 Tax=Sesamum latifolium TaxID=2727402 RepID=A0AAW2XRW2_9LAMI